jgi:hypothetical protein
MAVLIGLLNLTLTGALAVLVLLARERLHLGSVGYGLLFTCAAAGGLLGSAIGDRLIAWVTATWTIRVGLMVEAGLHLALATSRSPYLVGIAWFAFGVHSSLWTIVGTSLRQRLTPPAMLGRVASTTMFIAAGGNCAGALIAGGFASKFGITAPYWPASRWLWWSRSPPGGFSAVRPSPPPTQCRLTIRASSRPHRDQAGIGLRRPSVSAQFVVQSGRQ